LRPGADPQPPARPAAPLEPLLPLRGSRPEHRQAHQPPCRGHVRGQDRRAGAHRGAFPPAQAPVHVGADEGRARSGPRPAHRAQGAAGGGGEPREPTEGLLLPPALPVRHRRLPAGDATLTGAGAGPSRRLSQGRGTRPRRHRRAGARGVSGLTAWTGGRVVLPHAVVDGRAVLTEGGRIVAVVNGGEVPAGARVEELGGAFLLPGLIDIHTHGALGVSFLDGDDAAFAKILGEQVRRGVTGLLATTSTAPLGDIIAALEATRHWRDAPAASARPAPGDARTGGPYARVLGAHVEGPYFAAAQAGAQDPANLRNPDDGSVEQLLEHADVVRIVSYAPELPGAVELTRRLVSLG